MNLEKHKRSVTLACRCGNTQFSHPDDQAPEPTIWTCMSCGHQTTKAAMTETNRAAIDTQLERMKADVRKDVQDEVKRMLSNAFGGNKNIKIKL